MLKYQIALVIGLLCALAPAAQAAAPNAALLYHNYCSVCHGDRGNGDSRASRALTPPPRDFTAPEMKRVLTRERIRTAISHGRPGTAMVGWSSQLSAEQIDALTDYLLTTFIHPQADPLQQAGRQIYEQNCAVCHGDDGRSGRWTQGLKLKPRDFTSERARQLSREAMIETVEKGRPGTPMAAFAGQLTPEQIAQVVDYIRASFMQLPQEIPGLSGTYAHGKQEAETAAAKATAEKAPQRLSGNAERGRDFYMGNCYTCHGINGDGNGPRAYFINPKPANFLSERYRERLQDRDLLLKVIREGKVGTEMPAWGKVIDAQLIADLGEFVYSEFIAPADKKKP